MATKPWRFAPLRRTAVVALVVAVGVAAGAGAVALTQGGGSDPTHRPLTPSVAAFHFPTGGVIQRTAVDPAGPTDVFVEPASGREALDHFLGAERDGLTATSYRLLTTADQQDVGSAAAWTATSANRPKPISFAVTSERPSAEGEEITVDVGRHPSLDQFAGFVSAHATQVWRVVHEGATWRVGAEPLSEGPVLPPIAAAADVAGRWLEASAACNRTAAAALEGVADLIGPDDLLGAPCAERGAWTAAGPAMTLDRAPDTQALVEAYGPDVGTWTRLVPVRGPRTHFLAAVAPLGDDWRVIGATSDGG